MLRRETRKETLSRSKLEIGLEPLCIKEGKLRVSILSEICIITQPETLHDSKVWVIVCRV